MNTCRQLELKWRPFVAIVLLLIATASTAKPGAPLQLQISGSDIYGVTRLSIKVISQNAQPLSSLQLASTSTAQCSALRQLSSVQYEVDCHFEHPQARAEFIARLTVDGMPWEVRHSWRPSPPSSLLRSLTGKRSRDVWRDRRQLVEYSL